MALLFNLMEKGHLNWTIGLPLAACDRESGADLQFEPLKIESNHATRAYIHHRSWLGYLQFERLKIEPIHAMPLEHTSTTAVG